MSAANPLLSFPLTSEKTVQKSASSSGTSSPVTNLTRRLAAGDEAAFREFHAQYFDRLYRFLLVVARGQEQEARDALQETLLRVARYARTFQSQEIFWAWIKAVARSAARDAGRKQQRYAALLEKFARRFDPGSCESFSGEEGRMREALEASLAELTSEERHLLEAKYIAGSTVRELCCETGATEKAVESRLGRLRLLVRERVLKKLR
jgi:RNA polymerase sigma-70 factor (ECF subfamily)